MKIGTAVTPALGNTYTHFSSFTLFNLVFELEAHTGLIGAYEWTSKTIGMATQCTSVLGMQLHDCKLYFI